MRIRKISIDEIKQLLHERHGNVVTIDESTYDGMSHPCRFFDKDYGEWWTHPKRVIRFGASHPKRSSIKRQKTNISKYGVMCVLHSETGKRKKIETWIKNYGVDNPSKSFEIKEKKKQTCLNHFGVDNSFKSDLIKQKIKQTCIEKYGVSSFMKTDVGRQLTIDRNQKNICKQSTRQLRSINARKQMKNDLKSRGKSGKRVDLNNRFFRSMWEANFARILNLCQIEWHYECETFDLAPGFTYTPDFKILDIYIEIKGWMDERSKRQIDEFRIQYPDKLLIIIGPQEYKLLTEEHRKSIQLWEN